MQKSRKNHIGSILVQMDKEIDIAAKNFSECSGLNPAPLWLEQKQVEYREKKKKSVMGRAYGIYNKLEKRDPFCREGYYPDISPEFASILG